MEAFDVAGEHQDLLKKLKALGKDSGGFPIAKYLGTTHVVYNVPVPELQRLAKDWATSHYGISQDDLVSFVDALFRGTSREEKKIASLILGKFFHHLQVLGPVYLDRWMGELTGWEEVDSFCDEIDTWLRVDSINRITVLTRWNTDAQIEKRRASLVVLCSSVRHDDSKTFRDLSFTFIAARKGERHVMITKAISWLLRSLIKYHKSEVARYLKENESTLPSIAIREVSRKLTTGKK